MISAAGPPPIHGCKDTRMGVVLLRYSSRHIYIHFRIYMRTQITYFMILNEIHSRLPLPPPSVMGVKTFT